MNSNRNANPNPNSSFEVSGSNQASDFETAMSNSIQDTSISQQERIQIEEEQLRQAIQDSLQIVQDNDEKCCGCGSVGIESTNSCASLGMVVCKKCENMIFGQ